MNYTETSFTPNNPWRATTRASDNKRAGRLAKGNGTTNFGEIKAGTILSRNGDSLLRPMGFAQLFGAVAASNDVILDNATGFYVSDSVRPYARNNKTKAITNNSVVISIVSKVAGLNLVITVGGTSTVQSSSYDPATKTITFVSATNGGGTATSTHTNLTGELVTKYGGLIESALSATPATIVAALSSTPLGLVKGEAITTARTVSAKTSNTLTLSGAALTLDDDDFLVVVGSFKPECILDETVSTVHYKGTTMVAEDLNVTIGREGDARDSVTFIPNLPAGDAAVIVKRALAALIYLDPTDGVTEVLPPAPLVGFRFLPE